MPAFAMLGDGLRESTLETHQFMPINGKLVGPNSLAFHPASPVDHFGGAYQHFFRIAPPQRAGAPERSGINYCDLPSCGSTSRCHRRCACPRSNCHKVKLFGHFSSLEVGFDRSESNYLFEHLDILIGRWIRKSCKNRVKNPSSVQCSFIKPAQFSVS
jgi:hypothetical protein